jgi:hypothetical protein
VSEREQQVVELLRLRHEWVFDDERAPRSCLTDVFELGEKATEWFECPRCAGRKVMGKGRAERPCDRCNGEGRVLGDSRTFGASKSKQAVEYERATGVAETERLEQRRRYGELRRLEREALHREGLVDPAEQTALEWAKRDLWRRGSFAELEVALRVLGRRSAYDRAALEVVYGYDSPLRTVGPELQKRADLAVALVARLMPEEIEAPKARPVVNGTGRHANGWAQRERDREIWRLHTVDRLSREQIARRMGIDRSTVSRVLAPKATEAA